MQALADYRRLFSDDLPIVSYFLTIFMTATFVGVIKRRCQFNFHYIQKTIICRGLPFLSQVALSDSHSEPLSIVEPFWPSDSTTRPGSDGLFISIIYVRLCRRHRGFIFKPTTKTGVSRLRLFSFCCICVVANHVRNICRLRRPGNPIRRGECQ